MQYNKFFSLTAIAFLASLSVSFGQALLTRNLSLDVRRQRLDHVLEILSNKGNFYFSYNSNSVNKDSLVTLNVVNKPVKDILTLLFSNAYEFRESGNYIIIRRAPIRLVMVTKKGVVEEKIYSVSGFVYDEQSGIAVNEASVYEKKLLAATLTDHQGFFKIRLKSSKASFAALTISKEFYEDTTVQIEPRRDQEVTVTLLPIERQEQTVTVTPEDYLLPDSVGTGPVPDTLQPAPIPSADTVNVERTGMGRFLLSAKQKVQSLNLKHFFTTRPFQVSVVPGLGTHGRMSGQVINNFSLNILGGYTAGTNGLEIGGLFNIDKKEVRYVQVGGLFNVAGGEVLGVQVAGINNTVLDTVKALQAAGVNNLVRGKFNGLQIAGVYNHVTDSVRGMQVAGVGNFARRKVSGVQIAGVMNFSNRQTDGVQVAGVINYSKRLKGVQIGLINIADTSEGYSIGLINIVLKGYHKLSLFTNEVVDMNAAFKTGNARLYSILQAGAATGSNRKVYSFGYGLGSELALNKRKNFSLNPEVSSQYLYLGSWDYTNILNRLQLSLNVKLHKYVSLFAGPVYSVFVSDQHAGIDGYAVPRHGTHSFSNTVSGWFGWTAGISFF
ncbi:MAG: STN domain-containing protein [Chitinophagaceae bacterium]